MEVQLPREFVVSDTTKEALKDMPDETPYAIFEVPSPGCLIPLGAKFKYNGRKYIVADISKCLDTGAIINAKKFAGVYKEDDDKIHLLD